MSILRDDEVRSLQGKQRQRIGYAAAMHCQNIIGSMVFRVRASVELRSGQVQRSASPRQPAQPLQSRPASARGQPRHKRLAFMNKGGYVRPGK
jgi:hypothetical protein